MRRVRSIYAPGKGGGGGRGDAHRRAPGGEVRRAGGYGGCMPSRASMAVYALPTRFRREGARLVSDSCRRSRSRRRSRVRRFVEVAVEGNQPAMGEIAGQSPADSYNHCLYTRHVWPKMSLIASGGEVAEVAVDGCNNCNSCRGWLCMLAPWRGNELREKSAIPPLTARRGI